MGNRIKVTAQIGVDDCVFPLQECFLHSADCLVRAAPGPISVTSGATVRLKQQTYSVPAKLIGLKLDAHLSENQVRFTYEGHEVCQLPPMQGTRPQIDYRHVITWLVRKPGAFRGYIYREEMFPTVVFRQAYDRLCATDDGSADG